MKNLELKSKCVNLEKLCLLMFELGAEYQKTMHQIDTYFNAPKGRLKLREIDGEIAQFVYYERADESAPRYSNYSIVEITDASGFKQMMMNALGVKAIVDKVRELWMYGNTRIHVDDVNGLGHFVELETVITNQTNTEAQAEHHLVKRALEIDAAEIVPVSYSDLILKSKDGQLPNN
ncbi:class IV adenylate cyclase [Candidatus Poribacteria bacterium]|nr:class IV adenylate cyclase [Candidatus Poribacteria bacterium]